MDFDSGGSQLTEGETGRRWRSSRCRTAGRLPLTRSQLCRMRAGWKDPKLRSCWGNMVLAAGLSQRRFGEGETSREYRRFLSPLTPVDVNTSIACALQRPKVFPLSWNLYTTVTKNERNMLKSVKTKKKIGTWKHYIIVALKLFKSWKVQLLSIKNMDWRQNKPNFTT